MLPHPHDRAHAPDIATPAKAARQKVEPLIKQIDRLDPASKLCQTRANPGGKPDATLLMSTR